ncbi:MAG: type IV pili twitching motility protein PilT [Epsilonproteobacteria bacterium]|nr:type IV pili twitching motility protein PilT [Campylobacterota bacterium]NPA63945.1 type IV pilus twitching motility protein PilT [Campylobacterota bacterium]
MQIDMTSLFKTVVAHNASDLHLVAGSEPQVRIDGRLVPLNLPKLTGDEVQEICYSLLTEKQKKEFEENFELDFAFTVPNVGRFRANYYKSLDNVAAAYRIIPSQIPSLDTLGAPAVFKSLIKREKGLILVTGPTGSGKSTTLAAMLNEINETEHKHIITIEDPVEFIHQNKRSLFSHRELGVDTKSYANALKYALREDPDVILIGEMRDQETIQAALTAAETGHLVFGTLHTNSAPGTINRIIDVFSGDQQPQIRAQLSTSLVAVISQALLPKIGGGRIAVHEILINNPAISNLIRENKIHQIYSQMQLGQQQTGMQTQTKVLQKLLINRIIDKETAMKYSNKPEELANFIRNL